MSLSQYQSIVAGFSSGNSQITESAGERFSTRREGYLQRAGNLRNLIQQQAENKYSSAIAKAENTFTGEESAYDAVLKLYGDKVKKYQSEVLTNLGVSEEDQARASSVMGFASTITPLAGQLGKYALKSLNQSSGTAGLVKGGKIKPNAKSLRKKLQNPESRKEPEPEPEAEATPEATPKPINITERQPLAADERAGYSDEFGTAEMSSDPAVSNAEMLLNPSKARAKMAQLRAGKAKAQPQPEAVDEPPVVQSGQAGPSNAQLPQDIEMQDLSNKPFSMEMKDMTGKTISRNQAPNVLQEQQKLEDDARQEEETENVKEDTPDIFDDPTEAVGSGALEAETGAVEAEEVGTSALSGLLADAGDLGVTLAGIGSEALGPLGILAGVGLGVYELGNSFHWWGGGHSETPDPPPEKPDVKPPTAPDLQDIPKPKNIIVKDVAPSKSISAHYNLVSAPTMNSNIMRR
jgi:hypothetical protein